MESLRKWVHEGVIGIMTDSERLEWESYPEARKGSYRALLLFFQRANQLLRGGREGRGATTVSGTASLLYGYALS